jgi:hypothetical protein
MLDMGFIEDVEDIAAELKEGHQTVLFSATMNQKVRKLSERLLTDPVKVEIKQDTMVAKTIDHKLMNVTRRNKSQLLVQILQGENVEKVLVFSRTKRGADELSDMLYNEGIRSDAIHGDKKQRVREKILMNFKRGRTAVLVATDVAARGIDVDGISHVVNYELPIEPENYVHRVGRTGRAGASGIAISFCDPSDIRLLRNIEELIKMKITVDEEHEFHIPLANGAHSMKRGGGDFGRGGRSGGGRERGAFGRNRERGAFGRELAGPEMTAVIEAGAAPVVSEMIVVIVVVRAIAVVTLKISLTQMIHLQQSAAHVRTNGQIKILPQDQIVLLVLRVLKIMTAMIEAGVQIETLDQIEADVSREILDQIEEIVQTRMIAHLVSLTMTVMTEILALLTVVNAAIEMTA